MSEHCSQICHYKHADSLFCHAEEVSAGSPLEEVGWSVDEALEFPHRFVAVTSHIEHSTAEIGVGGFKDLPVDRQIPRQRASILICVVRKS